jgi:hypothetical protein
VRLINRSMSNSRYRRMAMPMATGMNPAASKAMTSAIAQPAHSRDASRSATVVTVTA